MRFQEVSIRCLPFHGAYLLLGVLEGNKPVIIRPICSYMIGVVSLSKISKNRLAKSTH